MFETPGKVTWRVTFAVQGSYCRGRPPNSAIELIQGGAKIVLANGDVLKAQSDTASSLDIVTSFIDTISS